METEPPKVSKLPGPRSKLRAVLLFFVFIAAIMAAYRYGHQDGRRDGRVIPSTFNSYQIYSREYDVTDLVTTGNSQEPSGLSALIEHITTWASPSKWDIVGGYATISPGDRPASLVVVHTDFGHAEVAKLLTDIREEKFSFSKAPIGELLRRVSEMKKRASAGAN